jgi:hypothetical protein
MWNSGLGPGFGGGSPQGLAWVRGGFGSVLFDNRIGRKRDVGGGVLAGPWLSVGFLSASLGIRSGDRGLKRLLTVTFRQSSRFERSTPDRREADCVVLIEADVLELVKIQCSPEH